jgi:hypothetical protein
MQERKNFAQKAKIKDNIKWLIRWSAALSQRSRDKSKMSWDNLGSLM